MEHDALRVPSYEAWRKAFRRWATVAVAYNQITQEFAKNYEEHIVKLVEKLDRQGTCQRIAWRYDTLLRKGLGCRELKA